MITSSFIKTISADTIQSDSLNNIISNTDNLNEVIQQVQSFYDSAWNGAITLIAVVAIAIPLVSIIVQVGMIKLLIKNAVNKTEEKVNDKLKQLDKDYQNKINEIDAKHQETVTSLTRKINVGRYLLMGELAVAKAENSNYGFQFRVRHAFIAIDYFRQSKDQLDKIKHTFKNIITLLNDGLQIKIEFSEDDLKLFNSKLMKFFKDNFDEEYHELVFQTKKLIEKFGK